MDIKPPARSNGVEGAAGCRDVEADHGRGAERERGEGGHGHCPWDGGRPRGAGVRRGADYDRVREEAHEGAELVWEGGGGGVWVD